MGLVQLERRRDGLGHGRLVAGQHHGLADAGGVQVRDGLRRVFLDAVGDDDVAGVGAVHGHVDDGAGVRAGVPGGADLRHQLVVADGDDAAFDIGRQALAREFLDVRDRAAVLLVGVGQQQGLGDRVRRMALDVGGQVQQLRLVQLLGVHGGDREDAFGQRARLVEDDGLHAGEGVHIGGALDQDAFARSAADAAEEGERHGDDQRAGAGDHQEHQRPVDPGSPGAREEGRHDGQQYGQADDDGRIDPREARDEMFAARLVFGGVLHQLEDARSGGLAEDADRPHAQHAAEVDAAGQDLVTRMHAARHAFARQGYGVQG